jgi:hydroxymethylbilane synthase
MESNRWQGLVLAAAGIHRLGWHGRIAAYLDPEVFVPSPGQGVLAIEIRDDDRAAAGAVAAVHHEETAALATAERAFLRELGGSCQLPVGAYATWQTPGRMRLVGKIGDRRGRTIGMAAEGDDGERLGRSLARRILDAGGVEFIPGGGG